MRAPGIRRKGAASFEELKPACQLLILHEDFSTYTSAVEVCRRVMQRFGSELDFDIKCWNFIELADHNCARHAAKTAAGADIILLSLASLHLPRELDDWLHHFFISRHRAEGVLALILNSSHGPALETKKIHTRLQHLTRRLRMDFVSLFPGDDANAINVPGTETVPREARK